MDRMASELVLDTSAIVAIALNEDDCTAMVRQIDQAARIWVSAATLVEAGIVLSARLNRDARGLLAEFVEEARAEINPFGPREYRLAVEAFLRFGKGRHRAALNFGDCISYAAAMAIKKPLLYTGSDFTATDVLRLDRELR